MNNFDKMCYEFQILKEIYEEFGSDGWCLNEDKTIDYSTNVLSEDSDEPDYLLDRLSDFLKGKGYESNGVSFTKGDEKIILTPDSREEVRKFSPEIEDPMSSVLINVYKIS